MTTQKKIFIIAGPNGAGKTTFARELLPNEANCPVFVNADLFLSLASAEDAIARVAVRVRQGGHDVPADTIRRRFASGLEHFQQVYRQRVDYWQWFDNGGESPLLLAEGKNP